MRFKRSVGVLLAQADSDRCGGGRSLFTDSEGDLYATGNAWIKKGALPVAFDPDYSVDLNEIADSPAAYFTW